MKDSTPVTICTRKILRNIARANMKKAKIENINNVNPNFKEDQLTPMQRNWRDYIIEGKHLVRGSAHIAILIDPPKKKTEEPVT